MSSAARQTRLLEEVLRQPGNEFCADCRSPAPRWASVSLGIFLCVQCASVHRKMGTHLSRVKSVTMDLWQREDVDQMRSTGNLKANSLANPDESRHPPPTSTSEFNDRDSELEKFIRNKWERGLFRADRGEMARTTARPVVSAGKDYQDILARKIKESPLPDLPAAAPATKPPIFTSNGRTATKQHVQSNWDQFMEESSSSSSAPKLEKVGRRSTMRSVASAPAMSLSLPLPLPQANGSALVDTTVPRDANRTMPVVMVNTGSSWPPPQQQQQQPSQQQQPPPPQPQQQQPQYMTPQPTNPFNGIAYGQFQPQAQSQSLPQYQQFNHPPPPAPFQQSQQQFFPSNTAAFPLAATSPYSQFSTTNQSYFQQPMGMQQPQPPTQGMYPPQPPPSTSAQWAQQGAYGGGGMPTGWR